MNVGRYFHEWFNWEMSAVVWESLSTYIDTNVYTYNTNKCFALCYHKCNAHYGFIQNTSSSHLCTYRYKCLYKDQRHGKFCWQSLRPLWIKISNLHWDLCYPSRLKAKSIAKNMFTYVMSHFKRQHVLIFNSLQSNFLLSNFHYVEWSFDRRNMFCQSQKC